MSLQCPHCRAPVDAAATLAEEMFCTSCGSGFRIARDETTAWAGPEKRTLGKFELIEEVGAGAFGSVFRARDKELGRIVAVKIPRGGNIGSSGDSDRFLREARSVAQLRHPSIVPVFEVGKQNGLPYLVSEFIQGITLADLMTSERMTPRDAAGLTVQIADALHYAHEQGVVHRDVKPSNIMLEENGKTAGSAGAEFGRHVPRLMDFGLAKRDAGEMTMTMEGQVLGTPAYMSPEQARGDSHSVDGRSDVYSLGVILYQLLTGELPFQGNARMLLHQVLHDEPKPPRSRDPKAPRDLETICMKAMAKEPASRYGTAGELAADLRRFLRDEPILARPVSWLEKAWRSIRRHPTTVGLVAAVVLLLGIVVGVVARGMRSDGSSPRPADAGDERASVQAPFDDLPKVVADLDQSDPAWRLEEIESKRPQIPADENGALQIVEFRRAVAELNGRPESEGQWESAGVIRPWESVQKLGPAARLPDDEAAVFRQELRRVAPVLAQAQKMTGYERGRFPTAHRRDAVSTRISDHAAGRHLARLLQMNAWVKIQDGDDSAAAKDCLAILHVARMYEDEPMITMQLIRASILGQAMRTIERLLAQGECSEEELLAMQQEAEHALGVPMLVRMVRGERGALHHFLSSLAAGDVPDTQLLEVMTGITDRAKLPSGAEIRRIHARALERSTRFLELAKQPLEEQAALVKALDEESFSAPGAETPMARSLLVGPFRYLDPSLKSDCARLVEANLQHQAELRCMLTACAVERFRRAHGAWPQDLAALVPTYLKEVPRDPYDGKPLRFRRTGEGVVIYGLGSDRIDDGGEVTRENTLATSSTPGFELWDAAKRRKDSGQ